MVLTPVELVEKARDVFGPLVLPRPYVPIEPTAKQEWFLRREDLEVFFGGAAGGGKMLALDTPIPTPDGWTTIGEITLGDSLFDENGNVCSVVQIHPVDFAPVSYRLTFDDGTVVDACSDHLWHTYTSKDMAAFTRRDPAWRAARRAKRPSRALAVSQKPGVSAVVTERNKTNPTPSLPPPTGAVRTTREIAETLTVGRRSNHFIPVAGALDTEAVELPISPYVLGAWLGDGTSRDGGLTCADQGIIDALAAEGWHAYRVTGSGPYAWRIEGLTKALRPMGVLMNKHVPAVYMRASYDQRLALLQGLMDTDGYCAIDGGAEFTSTKKVLAEAVWELALSLGQKATIREGRATLRGRDCGPVWDVKWVPSIPVFRLQRKLERQRPLDKIRRTTRFRWVKSCERIPSKPMRCLTVSSDSGLFLASKSMIPTHNSRGLLMSALQHVYHPQYRALILRNAITEFYVPGGFHELCQDWLGPTDARFIGGPIPQWRFPSGASLSYGYLSNMNDIDRYKGAEMSFVGFEEAVGFTLRQYLGMFRVLRGQESQVEGLPVRVRVVSNPPTSPQTMPNAAWIKMRFIDPATREKGAVFIPSSLNDNPHIDRAAYLAKLAHMLPADRARLIAGDWDVMEEGSLFKREQFRIVPLGQALPAVNAIRAWDLAATEVSTTNPDPDYTVGLLLEVDKQGTFTVKDIVRGRWASSTVEEMIAQTAALDGRTVKIRIEQEPGSSGKSVLEHYKRHVLKGYVVEGVRASGSKEVRARPAAAAVGNGLVQIVEGCANAPAFLDEVSGFLAGASHDDTVDAFSAAHEGLSFARVPGVARSSVPRRQIRGVDPSTGRSDIRPRGGPF